MKIKLSELKKMIKKEVIKLNEDSYKDLYDVQVPKDHELAPRGEMNVTKEFRIGPEVSIELYWDGYYAVINLVHGTQVFWTRNWKEAKIRAREIQNHYSAM